MLIGAVLYIHIISLYHRSTAFTTTLFPLYHRSTAFTTYLKSFTSLYYGNLLPTFQKNWETFLCKNPVKYQVESKDGHCKKKIKQKNVEKMQLSFLSIIQ